MKLNKDRKHLDLQYTRNPIDQFLNHNKLKDNLAKLGKTSVHKQLVISEINLKSEYQTSLVHQSTNIEKKTIFINLEKLPLKADLNN